jgi:exodeoxyribonuclease VII small subunit
MSEIQEMPYNEALKELEGIVATLRSNECDIDRMVALTRRAGELLKMCRERLTTTEEQLKTVLAEL